MVARFHWRETTCLGVRKMLTPLPSPPLPMTLPPLRAPDVAWVPIPPYTKVQIPVRVH